MKRYDLIVILTLLGCSTQARAEGEVANGQRLYESRCSGCHSIDGNRVGPAHRGVVGRRAGSVAGYDYSAAVAGSSLIWTVENLDRWLSNPEGLIPGQKMWYAMSDGADRADLIAYLATEKTPEQQRGAAERR